MEENTTLEDIYNIFLSKISDVELANMPVAEFEEELFLLLKGALAKFTTIVSYELDETLEEFDRKLTDLEIDILATAMASAYLSPKILSIQNLKQRLGDKDYVMYSQANHLTMLISLKKSLDAEFHYWMGKYSLQNFIKENK